jgi:hypothetical protein
MHAETIFGIVLAVLCLLGLLAVAAYFYKVK